MGYLVELEEAKALCCRRAVAEYRKAVCVSEGTADVEYSKAWPDDEDQLNVMLFLDLEAVKERISSLHSAFSYIAVPEQRFMHTFAAKANPVKRVLEVVAAAGMGVEAASKGELLQALAAGVDSSRVVFDSPAKTKREISLAISKGVPLNVDNFQELQRVVSVVKTLSSSSNAPLPAIGIRVNPQVGAGSIGGFSTGTKASKFGIPLESRALILEAFGTHSFLTMLHCHVGSQGCDFELMLSGIKAVVQLAQEINDRTGGQVTHLDIGGGLPVNFSSDEVSPTFEEYAARLKAAVPELFNGSFIVVTEFGRAIVAKAGFALCRVEYTKQSGGRHYATVQSGAEMFIRTVYHPTKWPLRVTVLNAMGEAKDCAEKELLEYDIAGPCCLGMDILAHQRMLPPIEPEDFLVFHDVGGYYHSSFSHYNARQPPAFMGYKATPAGDVSFTLLTRAQPLEEALGLYNGV